jgi:hypothetical protein
MKKILGSLLLGALVSSSSFAGVMAWGGIALNDDLIVWQDNVPSTFSGYAYLFLLTGEGNTVTWNSTTATWDLNGATQLAYSPDGAYYTDPDSSDPGTWGNAGSDVLDARITASSYYQAILVTTAGNGELKNVPTGGFWQSTTAKKLDDYNNGFDGVDRGGTIKWQTGSAWAPVAAVPEPATMALFGLGGLALVIRRKLRKEA